MVAPWLDAGGGLKIITEYGPTETVVGCAVHDARPEDIEMERIPIGRAIDDTRLYVLDSRLRPRPAGLTRELYIGGNSVAWVYWNRPDLTTKRFLANPYSDQPGARMYRTGDRVRLLPYGTLDCLGRSDDQIKINGYQIEPGEVEAVPRATPGVTQAVVTTAPTPLPRT